MIYKSEIKKVQFKGPKTLHFLAVIVELDESSSNTLFGDCQLQDI